MLRWLVRLYFYLLRLFNFSLLNLFIYVVLGYHIVRWWNEVVWLFTVGRYSPDALSSSELCSTPSSYYYDDRDYSATWVQQHHHHHHPCQFITLSVHLHCATTSDVKSKQTAETKTKTELLKSRDQNFNGRDWQRPKLWPSTWSRAHRSGLITEPKRLLLRPRTKWCRCWRLVGLLTTPVVCGERDYSATPTTSTSTTGHPDDNDAAEHQLAR